MMDTISHRGPDDSGTFSLAGTDWAVNLGMRRLSIIDRAGGHQPVHRGRASVICNGEIYNHRKLRHNLTQASGPFKTTCDTECVARAWDAYGANCLPMLDGMFAFAVWDRNAKALYLVRDRIGKKPLFYHWDAGRNLLVFGSEIKAILAHPHVKKEINPEGLFHYLSLQYVPEPMTAFKGIQCVPPGGMVMYQPEKGTLGVLPWYELKPQCATPGTPSEVTPECVLSVVSEAIGARLESEVPLGVYLSGGIDSSIIAAVAKTLKPNDLHTFSMGFAEDAYNELPQAKQLADRLGTIHHEAIVQLPQLPEMAQRIVAQYDQPFGDCSAIPTMLLAEESKKYITVALTGDGGDEAFGGYERYWTYDRKQGIGGYIPWMSVIPFGARDRMLDPEFKKSIAGSMHTMGWMLQQANYPGKDLVNQMGWLDVKTYLLNDIIVKMERASMAASVEARCPFLDHRVMELAFAIPGNRKIEAGVGKLVLKDAFKHMLPMAVIARPKRGFGVPMDSWLRSPVGRQMLMEMTTDLAWPWGILQGSPAGTMIESHLNGRANCGHAIYMLLMLHGWLKRNFG